MLTKREQAEELIEQGVSCAEIARQMQLPPSTVRCWKRSMDKPDDAWDGTIAPGERCHCGLLLPCHCAEHRAQLWGTNFPTHLTEGEGNW